MIYPDDRGLGTSDHESKSILESKLLHTRTYKINPFVRETALKEKVVN